ncbi:hypothetical protein Y032_0629g839 [Ancylostoma ceylanicum]|uniref:Uncharacterized protein n=1 Tax=Ancylostoma ceylanicum TaxID=53326 RepID=A0A016WJV8_9BILA|nr:hypothetical protein Y032_0629g839 [Ancylostoma ceylanicum]
MRTSVFATLPSGAVDHPFTSYLPMMLPVWREDSDSTRRRLARVVCPHIRQFAFISKCIRRKKGATSRWRPTTGGNIATVR